MEKGPTAIERATRYVRDVRAEMRKVVWPNLRQTAAYTAVVLISVAMLALSIFVVDSLFRAAIGLLIK